MDISTVYCVVPVHNRLETTKSFLIYLQQQDYASVKLIIIDDGSTDGTGEYLASLPDANLMVIKGNGNLWWSGAMYIGLDYVKMVAKEKDYLLMVNDDVRFERNYISTLVYESFANNLAVVGSSQRDEASGAFLTCGYKIDYYSMRFIPLNADTQISIDALPGRGVLFPMSIVNKVGNINKKFFPHYFSDLDYTTRISELGFKVVISKSANIFTSSIPSDLQVRSKGIISKYFSFNSRNNQLQKILFFSIHGPIILKFLAFPRLSIIYFLRSIFRNYGK